MVPPARYFDDLADIPFAAQNGGGIIARFYESYARQ
jgi:hypothetical protein